MLPYTLLIALGTFSFAFTLPQPLQSTGINGIASLISSDDCSFYLALNTLFQCDSKSHLIQYSQKYCQRLVNARNTFENTVYQDTSRKCLQQKLFEKVQKAKDGSITCDGLKKMDLDSHGTCLSVSFKQLPASDVEKFIAIFKDTTTNYAQLCRIANGFAGHWSQMVKGDLMLFVKKQLKVVFPEGDTSACSIKEKEIIDEITDIIKDVSKIVDQVKSVKDDIVTVINKSKDIRDDFKSIQETIKGLENGSISELDGIKTILQKTKDIKKNFQTTMDTIKKLAENKSGQNNTSEKKADDDFDKVLGDMISIIDQTQTLKGDLYNVTDNVNSIIDTINEIRDGDKDIFDGLKDIVKQVGNGIDNIHSIINTTDKLKDTVVDLVDTIFKDVDGAIDGVADKAKGKVDEVVGAAKEKVDEVVGGAKEKVDEAVGGATDAIGGALGGFGK